MSHSLCAQEAKHTEEKTCVDEPALFRGCLGGAGHSVLPISGRETSNLNSLYFKDVKQHASHEDCYAL